MGNVFLFKLLALLCWGVSFILGVFSCFLPDGFIWNVIFSLFHSPNFCDNGCLPELLVKWGLYASHPPYKAMKASRFWFSCPCELFPPCSYLELVCFPGISSNWEQSLAHLLASFFGTQNEWCESTEEIYPVSIQVSDHPAAESWAWRDEDLNPPCIPLWICISM